jgi:RNA polymerase sigma-70 factor (ECF subfamily)
MRIDQAHASATSEAGPPAEESELIHLLCAGDDAAYESLIREHGGHMLAVAGRFFRDAQDAADAVQDAFISAFQSIGRFEADSKLSTWLHRIIVNACLMKLRSRRRRETTSLDEFLPQFASDGHHARPVPAWSCPVARTIEAETREQVRRAIDDMPDAYREILLLRDIEEFDTEETARLLNTTVANVKTRLHRARQVLRTHLEMMFAVDAAPQRPANQT